MNRKHNMEIASNERAWAKIMRKIYYLIFVPKNPQVKEEFSSMYQTQKKVILHEFSMYKMEGGSVIPFILHS